jgi:mannosyltransferase OCH1-like enzyme
MKSMIFLFLLNLLPLHSAHPLFPTTYEEAFFPFECRNTEKGALFQSFYEAMRHKETYSEEPLIPHVVHFIWLGSELPSEQARVIETWRQINPDWQVKIWTDRDVPEFKLRNQEAFDRAVNYGEKSDIFRYEILYRYGGIYADIDFECLQPFDKLVQTCDFFTGLNGDNEWLLNGILGARPDHPILKECVENIRVGNGDHDCERIMHYTGPYYFTRSFLSALPASNKEKILLLPPTYFYPFPAINRSEFSPQQARELFARPESLTVHLWFNSWQKNKH